MTNVNNKNIKIEMPSGAKKILEILHKEGFEAYIVGGCVRDCVLGRNPQDWDITTSALPQQVKRLFKKTIDTGIKHGTVTILIGGGSFEVTTYRIDGEYEDFRHPKEVTFTRSLIEDMQRRDFTINAMAYNDEEGLIDHFEGLLDIERKMIRCVGDPHQRFSEDALRIMRAVRFSAQLDYEIEQETRWAAAELAGNLVNISSERIQVELVKMMCSDHPEKIADAYEMGITKVILPEFDRCMQTPQNNPHHMYNVGDHIIKCLTQIEADKVLRLTMLFHDIAKPLTRTTDDKGIDHFKGHDQVGASETVKILRRLKFDNDTITRVSNLVKWHDVRGEIKPKNIRRLMNRVGTDFPLLFDIRYADTMAQSEYYRDKKLASLEECRKLYEEIALSQPCVDLKSLAVNGKDLIERGVEPGRKLGAVLKAMLEDVIDEPSINTRDYLLDEKNIEKYEKIADISINEKTK